MDVTLVLFSYIFSLSFFLLFRFGLGFLLRVRFFGLLGFIGLARECMFLLFLFFSLFVLFLLLILLCLLFLDEEFTLFFRLRFFNKSSKFFCLLGLEVRFKFLVCFLYFFFLRFFFLGVKCFVFWLVSLYYLGFLLVWYGCFRMI